jgi:hypothetical protein
MARPRDFNDILSRIPGARQSGDYWTAPCNLSGHKTPAGHLTLKDGGDKALVTCHGGRHDFKGNMGDYEALCRVLGFDSLAYSNNGIGADFISGEGRYSVTPSQKQGNLASEMGKGTVAPPALQSVTGVTVAQLADAKRLPVDFLKSLGITDFKYNGQPAIRIPYYSEDGQEIAIRFRLALFGDSRFKWRKGDHVLPCGLNRLATIRKVGWGLVVEGESDCWTCWLHGIPALGAPGKDVWPLTWAEYLKGLEVYVWQEPGAEDFTLRLLASVPDLRYIPAPDGIKDISEAHIQGLDIPSWLEGLKAKAESGQALKQWYDNERLSQLYHEANAVIEAEDPLELIKDAIRGLGYGGDLKPVIITYCAATSRLLEMREGAMPVHLLLMGLSSSGKNFTLGRVLALLPSEAYHVISAGSPRTIIYDATDLQHRLLVFGEADSLPAGEDNPAASAIRNLLQDHQLHYEVTIRSAGTGDYTVRKVVKPGPTVLITTSTRSLGHQLMTRLFTLEVSDSKEQISAALQTQAAIEIEGSKLPASSLVAFQHYLQLRAPFKVVVPYAGELAEAMGKTASAPRILRDFARLLSLIKSVVILRHHWRQVDSEGRLIAAIEDYGTVRNLVNDMYVDSSMGITGEIKALVGAVKTLDANRVEGERITVTKLADFLQIGKMAASRRAKRALREGWLVNRESRKGYPADYTLGEPMPEVEGLPILGYNTVTDRNIPLITDSSFKNGDCNAITPLTNDNTSPPPDDDIPSYPTTPCHNCGSSDYWLTDWNKWLCSRCHPQPERVKKVTQ